MDKIRYHNTSMSLEEFKKKVNYTWNRIPKHLCRNIVNKFDSIVQAVYNNKGHKENKNNRKEKKPKRIVKFRIKDRTGLSIIKYLMNMKIALKGLHITIKPSLKLKNKCVCL